MCGPPAAVISHLPAGATQLPQAASQCALPPAAVICHLPAGATQPPQAASLCARPPAAVINLLQPTPVFLIAGVDISALSAAQGSYPEVAAMASKASLRVSSSTFQGCQLLCDFSTGAPRPLLPRRFRAAFAAVYTIAHPGIRATKRLMSALWVWTGISTDITRWSRDSQFCQRAKVTRQPRPAVQQMPIPARQFLPHPSGPGGPPPKIQRGF